MKRWIWILFIGLLSTFCVAGISTASYVDLINYADAVYSYAPGPNVTNNSPGNALGIEDTLTVSLGSRGELVLEFTDNALTGDGTTGADIAVLDHGAYDGIYVYIGTNTDNWLYVGLGTAYVGNYIGTWNRFDIDHVTGYNPNALYRYVRLVDHDPNGTDTSSGTPGFDVDAVATINYAAPVPVPGTLLLLASGILMIFSLKKRQ